MQASDDDIMVICFLSTKAFAEEMLLMMTTMLGPISIKLKLVLKDSKDSKLVLKLVKGLKDAGTGPR